eukprot:27777-Eustigmatos_ZCMA.PRE.1
MLYLSIIGQVHYCLAVFTEQPQVQAPSIDVPVIVPVQEYAPSLTSLACQRCVHCVCSGSARSRPRTGLTNHNVNIDDPLSILRCKLVGALISA